MLRWQTGEHEGAKQDADYLLEHECRKSNSIGCAIFAPFSSGAAK